MKWTPDVAGYRNLTVVWAPKGWSPAEKEALLALGVVYEDDSKPHHVILLGRVLGEVVTETLPGKGVGVTHLRGMENEKLPFRPARVAVLC